MRIFSWKIWAFQSPKGPLFVHFAWCFPMMLSLLTALLYVVASFKARFSSSRICYSPNLPSSIAVGLPFFHLHFFGLLWRWNTVINFSIEKFVQKSFCCFFFCIFIGISIYAKNQICHLKFNIPNHSEITTMMIMTVPRMKN